MNKKSKETPIGERIREVFKQKKMTVSRFAELLHCTPSKVQNIFRRKKMDVDLLMDISNALEHNFIADICANHKFAGMTSSPETILVIEIRCVENDTIQQLLKTLKRLNIKVINGKEKS